ncbi:MAG TPA: hypothetical protein VKO83_06395, partial [Steroidobacteraceae bacterium]|nr:hypothetical protein [Steroidobacteraceae bacterium]
MLEQEVPCLDPLSWSWRTICALLAPGCITVATMRMFGHEISRTPGQADFLRSRLVDLVLDVGANRGQYASGLRRQGYRGRIHS